MSFLRKQSVTLMSSVFLFLNDFPSKEFIIPKNQKANQTKILINNNLIYI